MSWFNASHLSSFAKQALTTAQKSIDRVLDIKEEDQWADTTVMPYDDVTLPGKLSLSGGWGMTQWEAPPEEKSITPPPSSEAITTPVTRTVVDESENFFSAFLSPVDVQGVTQSQVVSVPPTKSQRRPQEKEKTSKEPPVSPVSASSHLPSNPDGIKTNVGSTGNLDSKTEQSHTLSEHQVEQDTTDSSKRPTVTSEPKTSTTSDPSPSSSSKEVLLEHKDSKVEDRQNDTPSPPVSAFSSGTSTTSDIEVLDHESVLSESSASSRQETGEGKASLHLMQGSFQLLTASTCGDFPRLEDYPKLTESCGSSSDAFERIDSFSVQSLDSRSVSEVNSDDEIPGSRTLASVTAGPTPITVSSAVCQKEEDGVPDKVGEDEEEGFTETMKEQSLDEMEESGRSATPVNSEQPEELTEQESEANVTLSDPSPNTEERRLEKRESQLLAVSKDKARLEEECDNLKDEVISLKEETSTVQSLKDEFTQRIADSERKAQLACKERDIAKKEIKGLREELSTRLNSSDTMEIIKEKEEQIRGLLEEGEKLSKQQLQHSNIIKKLRVKEKESDSKIIKQQKKMKEFEEELKHLQQVADLRLALQRAEQQQARKEDYLREEISELQQRLQEAENRNQELSQSVTSATRPLLRQIENLQASLGGQTASWEKLEKNISDRLADAQAQLAVAVEKERSAVEELLSIKSQLASLESQNTLLRQEKARHLAQLETEKNKREKLEDDSSREHIELENLRGEHSRMLEEAKKEKLLLSNQLEMEKMKVEQEKKKCYLAQEALKEKERKAITHSVGEHAASSTPSLSRSSSISGPDNAGLQTPVLSQDSLDHSLGTMTMSISMSGTNLYEAARLSGGSSIFENLQSQLKLREGEISQLQLEISSLERSRSVMAEELVRLTNQNDEMEDKVKEIPKLKIQLKDLEQRHNTILQMYGEKAEEAEELRLDLEDVKNMYKTQIDELLQNQK
uniref:TATA element modulatory factor 1 TATA binding domain-containing protein n=1 Tax=Echeneis naucrates TaxID=173247 RepID=A0A665U2T9_ECHNA